MNAQVRFLNEQHEYERKLRQMESAAPAMLKALQAVKIADRLNAPEWNAAMRLVDAALAKAGV